MTSPTQPVHPDNVLAQLAAARKRRDDADRLIRQLVAYGRTGVRPRPYTLAALAEAAGMSISGVRTCYRHTDAVDVTAIVHVQTEPPEES